MPRSDSSGSSRGRRGSSRPTEGKGAYSNKRRSSGPSDKKSKPDGPSSGFRKSDGDKPRGTRSSGFGKPDGDKKPFKSGFGKRDNKGDQDKPREFKRSAGSSFKRRGDSDERGGRGGARRPGSDKPRENRSAGFKKFDDNKRPSRSGFGKRDRDNDKGPDQPRDFKRSDSSSFKRRGDSDQRGGERKFTKRPDGDSPRENRSSGFGRTDDFKKGPPRSGFRKRDGDSSEGKSSGFKRSEKSSFAKKPPESPADGERRFSSKPGASRFSKKYDEKPSGRRERKAPPAFTPTTPEAPVQSDKIRLNKFISNSGVCSRREADELITMGLISVNGKTITELGYKVNPGDEIRYESKVLRSEKPVYVLMNKPKGYLTTTSDPQERNTVMHIIGNAVKERIYPVGRLDRNTTGLLVLTNDGDLADKLMHPSYNAKKIYKAELDRPLTKADFDRIVEGVQLEEGRAMVDDVAIVSDDKKTVGLEIHIGWNRVVRRIFEALDYQVVKLDRSVYAGLDKKDLPRGHWRMLTNEEIVRLKHYAAPAKKGKPS